MGSSDALDLLDALSSTKKQDPLRLTLFGTSPGSPGEEKEVCCEKLCLHRADLGQGDDAEEHDGDEDGEGWGEAGDGG